MKIPNLPNSRMKIRDTKIIMLYSQGMTMKEVAQYLVDHKYYTRTNVVAAAQNTVARVLWKNREVLKLDRDYENFKQSQRILRVLNKIEPGSVALGYENLLHEKLKKEKETTVNNETKVIIVRESNGDKDKSGDVSRPLSVVRV